MIHAGARTAIKNSILVLNYTRGLTVLGCALPKLSLVGLCIGVVVVLRGRSIDDRPQAHVDGGSSGGQGHRGTGCGQLAQVGKVCSAGSRANPQEVAGRPGAPCPCE